MLRIPQKQPNLSSPDSAISDHYRGREKDGGRIIDKKILDGMGGLGPYHCRNRRCVIRVLHI